MCFLLLTRTSQILLSSWKSKIVSAIIYFPNRFSVYATIFTTNLGEQQIAGKKSNIAQIEN